MEFIHWPLDLDGSQNPPLNKLPFPQPLRQTEFNDYLPRTCITCRHGLGVKETFDWNSEFDLLALQLMKIGSLPS